MSKLCTPQGDDHPEAAGKHLADAEVLLAAGRSDGAAYLSGYVVECSLKAVCQLESETRQPPWGHNVPKLAIRMATLSSMAGAKTAKYLGPIGRSVDASVLASWVPEMRYRAPSMTLQDASDWVQIANQVFNETVFEMWQDGVL
jgi:HEPN domain-containing protein